MKFDEITSRLTGISCPIFGVSWNPPESERKIARRVITFLETAVVAAAPWNEALAGVNAVRAASGLAPLAWTDILPPGTPAPPWGNSSETRISPPFGRK